MIEMSYMEKLLEGVEVEWVALTDSNDVSTAIG